MTFKFLFIFFSILVGNNILAQESNTATTTLDNSPITSARASGLGGAISPIVNSSEASHYNPAGIGGLHKGTTKKMPISVKFPYIGVSANENARNLRKEFSQNNGADDAIIGEAIVEANAGKRQYGRTSAGLELNLGRSLYRVFTDAQLAAIKTSGANESEGDISLGYRSISGAGMGFSFVDSKESFYLGSYTSYNARTEIFADNITYTEIITKEGRSQIQNDNAYKWSGVSTNVGMLWIFEKKIKPALAIVVRDIGESKYNNVESPTKTEINPKIIKQDLTVGFSVSPNLGKNNHFNFVLEGFNLLEANLSGRKKLRTGLEFNFDGFGTESLFAIQSGYNSAGASGGISVNLGILQLAVASEAVDIGLGNNSVLERRSVATLTVNINEE